MKIEKTHYGPWEHCYRVTNGEVELIVLAEAGPRILRYGFAGGPNFFRDWPDKKGSATLKTPDGEWAIIGGHRIWVAPELSPGSYPADNDPVRIEETASGLIATAPIEKLTRFEKQIVIEMAPSGTNVTVTHHIWNRGYTQQRMAAWALTVMAQNGAGVTGFPPRGTHPEVLAPTNPLIMWAFTDLSDPRWKFTKKYLVLKQDPAQRSPQKLGHFSAKTWGAYILAGQAFLKKVEGQPGREYPDMGSSFEIFTNADFLELETLGPLNNVDPGGRITHTEHWSLLRNAPLDPARFRDWTDAALDPLFASLQ
jgi:hypothetical protein